MIRMGLLDEAEQAAVEAHRAAEAARRANEPPEQEFQQLAMEFVEAASERGIAARPLFQSNVHEKRTKYTIRHWGETERVGEGWLLHSSWERSEMTGVMDFDNAWVISTDGVPFASGKLRKLPLGPGSWLEHLDGQPGSTEPLISDNWRLLSPGSRSSNNLDRLARYCGGYLAAAAGGRAFDVLRHG